MIEDRIAGVVLVNLAIVAHVIVGLGLELVLSAIEQAAGHEILALVSGGRVVNGELEITLGIVATAISIAVVAIRAFEVPCIIRAAIIVVAIFGMVEVAVIFRVVLGLRIVGSVETEPSCGVVALALEVAVETITAFKVLRALRIIIRVVIIIFGVIVELDIKGIIVLRRCVFLSRLATFDLHNELLHVIVGCFQSLINSLQDRLRFVIGFIFFIAVLVVIRSVTSITIVFIAVFVVIRIVTSITVVIRAVIRAIVVVFIVVVC